MNDIEKEFDGLRNDKKEFEESIEINKNIFAEQLKNQMGKEIKEELTNPTLKPIKHDRKYRCKLRWNEIKEKLNNYFFNY